MYKPQKRSPRYYASHCQDYYTDLGFDYRGQIFKKTISKEILENKTNRTILKNIEVLLSYLIDTVKQIRLQYMISLDKRDRNLN